MRYKTNLSQRGQADTATHRLAQGLGIFSIVLGLFELICGRWLGRLLGFEDKEYIVRLYGGREILTGVAILASSDPTPWVWGRVAGDTLDIGTLAYGYARDRDNIGSKVTALAAVTGATAADVYCAAKLSNESRLPLPPVKDYSNRSGFPNGMPRAKTDGAFISAVVVETASSTPFERSTVRAERTDLSS